MSPVSELPSTSSSSCDAGHQESQFGSCSYVYEGTNGRTKSKEEVALLEELNLLLDEARIFPVHSILLKVLIALETVSGDLYDVSELISAETVDEVFTKLQEIISLISPVEMSDFSDIQFAQKIDMMKYQAKAFSRRLEDNISLSTSGKDPECRLSELMDSISKLSKNATIAAIIRGDKKNSMWSRLARVDLEELLPEDEEECSVCKSVTINKDLNFVILSGCTHLLCESCATTWFEAKTTCPLCRQMSPFITTRDDFLELKRQQRQLETRYCKRRVSQRRPSCTRPRIRFAPY